LASSKIKILRSFRTKIFFQGQDQDRFGQDLKKMVLRPVLKTTSLIYSK